MKTSTDRIQKTGTCTGKNCTRTRTHTRCRSQPLYFEQSESSIKPLAFPVHT